MTHGGILGYMTLHSHKSNINLQGRIGQCPQQLQFRILLNRHQIQNPHVQRTDILVNGSVLIHYKYILILQHFSGRKFFIYSDRHIDPSLFIS